MAYYERAHPKITEKKLEATPEQLACIKDVREELAKAPGNPHADVTDSTLFRFSRINGFNVAKTSKAFLDYIEWRKSHKIDNVLDSEFAKIDVIKKIVPYRYSGFDNEGRPLYIEKTGKIAVSALADSRIVTEEEFVGSHIYGMEYLAKLAFEQSLAKGERIDTVSSILDLEGLGLQHRSVITMLKSCMDQDAKYYPERMGKIYVINAPWIAPTMYQLVQVFVDDYTKSCLEIINGDPKTALPTKIPVDNLPQEYGGKAENLPTTDAASLTAAADAVDDGLDKQYVSYDYEKVLECASTGGLFTWYFRSEGDYDIDFSVTAVKQNGEKIQVKPVSRCVTAKGSYTSNEAVKLTFRWDNNFSYLYGKNLRFHVGVHNIDLKLADAQSSASVADEAAIKK